MHADASVVKVALAGGRIKPLVIGLVWCVLAAMQRRADLLQLHTQQVRPHDFRSSIHT